jgi:hypothetical protein
MPAACSLNNRSSLVTRLHVDFKQSLQLLLSALTSSRPPALQLAAGSAPPDSRRFSPDISDRENLQYHWIQVENMPEIWKRLHAVGLQTTEAGGDCPPGGSRLAAGR